MPPPRRTRPSPPPATVPDYSAWAMQPGAAGLVSTPTAGDAEFAGSFAKSAAMNGLMDFLSPAIMAYVGGKDAIESFSKRRPSGVYADLLEMAQKVGAMRASDVVPAIQGAVNAKFDEAQRSPADAGRVIGEQVNPRNWFKRPAAAATAGIMAGRRSQTWDQGRAQAYEALEPGALDPSKMNSAWQQTRTYRGPDKQLRQEIDDSAAQINLTGVGNAALGQVPLSSVLDHPELYAAYPHLRNTRVIYAPDPTFRAAYFPAADQILLSSINLPMSDPAQIKSSTLHEIQHAIQEHENFMSGSNHSVAPQMAAAAVAHEKSLGLPQIPNGQAIDAAEAKLRDIRNQIASIPPSPFNHLSLPGNPTPDDFSMAMRGEVGKIWKRDGQDILRTIGNPPNPQKYPEAYSEWARKAFKELKKREPDSSRQGSNDRARLIYEEDVARQNLNNLTANTPGYENALLMRNVFNKRDQMLNNLSASDKYRFVGGEAEARAVQQRMLMDMIQRGQIHPLNSYDIPWRETFNNP